MTAALDQWWLACFTRLLDAEQSGVLPRSLEQRWMALDQHLLPRGGRWAVGFAVPEAIAHFLEDADVRTKDAAYANKQWAEAREWLNA